MDKENSNLVTFPSSKNFPLNADFKSNSSYDYIDEIEEFEWDHNFQDESLHKDIPHLSIKADSHFMSRLMEIDEVIDALSENLEKLQSLQKRSNFYLNEVFYNKVDS